MDNNFNIHALLLLGGNLGDVKKTLSEALVHLNKIGNVISQSSIYVTSSWGFNAPDFLNQALILETNLQPEELMNKILDIEITFGRKRNGVGYQSRTIDIDIILLRNLVIMTDKLIVPHPKMHERKFVLVPCNEIASDWIHPIFKCNIESLLNKCTDNGIIYKEK